MPENISVELQQFIAQHIESLAQLEMLLLLRQDRDRDWRLAEVSKQLYLPVDVSQRQLDDLERRGFFVRVQTTDNCFRYQPADPQLDRLLGELATVYQQRRVAVITMIYSKPVNKVQTFADAFRLRREE